MSDEPSRAADPQSPADAELSRLAAQGQHRMARAAETKAASRASEGGRLRDDVIRGALGAHFGSPVRTLGFCLFGACALFVAGAAVCGSFVAEGGGVLAGVCGALAVASFVGALIGVGRPPRASRARVEAERVWSTSLPFGMRGYFDLLASDDILAIVVVIDVTFASASAPDVSLVHDVVGALDVDARATRTGSNTVRIVSAALPNTWLNSIKEREDDNRQHVAYVHALVDRVLVPIHRSHPIASIGLSREVTSLDVTTRDGLLSRKW